MELLGFQPQVELESNLFLRFWKLLELWTKLNLPCVLDLTEVDSQSGVLKKAFLQINKTELSGSQWTSLLFITKFHFKKLWLETLSCQELLKVDSLILELLSLIWHLHKKSKLINHSSIDSAIMDLCKKGEYECLGTRVEKYCWWLNAVKNGKPLSLKEHYATFPVLYFIHGSYGAIRWYPSEYFFVEKPGVHCLAIDPFGSGNEMIIGGSMMR